MQLCNCSLPCCFSARWCHRLSRQGWEGDLGRWWRSVCVCVYGRGGECFCQIASLSCSDRHFQPSHACFCPSSPLPACCRAGEGSAAQTVRSSGVEWVGGSGSVGGNEKANRQPSCSLALKLFLHHATQIFAQDDAFLLLAALRPPAARCNSLSFSFDLWPPANL